VFTNYMSFIQHCAKLKLTMLVVDANDVSQYTQRDEARQSPVLHNAVHSLLDGLRDRDDIEVEVLYGRKHALDDEDRWEGGLHFVPVSYKTLPIPGIGGPYLGRTLALLRYLKNSKPDLVHAQGTERESGLVAALAGFPSILTLHGNLTEIAKSMGAKPLSYFGLASRLERFALGRVSGVHCISKHTQTSVAGRARQTWIIPNAVSSHYFNVTPQARDQPQVVCMSGISEWKNPILLAKASDALHSAFPGSQIQFFGACDKAHPYGRAFLDALESRPWCFFHGRSSPEVLAEALSRATCAVLPSKQENFGLALAEAMAAGVPCIGSDVGGIPDVIRHGKTGLLFPEGDQAALERCLIEIHQNPAMAQHMAIFGKADAQARFSKKEVATAHLRMYQELINARS
jgi:glycosyltransferase involved in cell wall biosynthesis